MFVPSPDAGVLRDWLLAERARAVIEIGPAYGASALAIAEALVTNEASDDALVIIDGFQDRLVADPPVVRLEGRGYADDVVV